MNVTRDELSKLVGYEVGREMRLMILKQTKETGKDIREIAAQYNLPTMAIVGDKDGKFYDIETDRRITPEEWHKSNPLGEYGRLIIVRECDL